MRDYLEIIKRNVLSPVVLAVFVLAGALLYVREYRDAWFMSVVISINTVIGVVQEIRAKRVLKKLELMNAPIARVERKGKIVEISYDKLRLGDMLHIRAGDELPADGDVVRSHGLELDESMLTGESAAVEKSAHDRVYAATVVTAGDGVVTVRALGADTRAGAISAVLKRYTPALTPLQRAIQTAITFLTYGAIVLSLLIFVSYYFSGFDSIQILKTITVASVTVIPEGLLLASSLLLAFGSLHLAQAKVLPQKLSAIEAMALLGVLCVDKTGTLTSDEVTLESCESFDAHTDVARLAALVARETGGGNITAAAILAAANPPLDANITGVLAFSSARKLAGVRAVMSGKTRTLVMGAPEFVAKLAPLNETQSKQIDSWVSRGMRVLLLAGFSDAKTPLKNLARGSGKPLGIVILRNSLRDGVQDTVRFLQGHGVSIRVISGDNPRTVQYIARAAGIHNPEKSITGAELAKLSDEAFMRAADEHTIFARVLPEQKERLIAHFRNQGKFTGMVGDGVNDALALKQADLGVAMRAGAPASRRVADLILLNNSFTSLPAGMQLGNRIIQAIEIIAILFFHKIIYGVVLLFSTIVLGVVYPYAPRHVTFLNIFLVTMPTIMWTLFPPSPAHRVDPRGFWRDTLRAVAPIAILTGLTIAAVYWIMLKTPGVQPPQAATMTVLIATFFGVYLVFLAGIMLGVTLDNRAKLARALYLAAVAVVAIAGFAIIPLRHFFDFTAPNAALLWPGVAIVAAVAVVQYIIAGRAGLKIERGMGEVSRMSDVTSNPDAKKK